MRGLLALRPWRRVAAVGIAGVAAYVGAALLSFEPDLVLVLLVTALAMAGFSLLGESVNPVPTEWYPPTSRDPLTRGRDGATFADLRLIESHQTARHPDDHLRRRLADLADRALLAADSGSTDTEVGRARLGPTVSGLLADPSRAEGPAAKGRRARRLSPSDIDLCLRTIEEIS